MLAFSDRDMGYKVSFFYNGINFPYIITEVYIQMLASADIEGGGGMSFMVAPNIIFHDILHNLLQCFIPKGFLNLFL